MAKEVLRLCVVLNLVLPLIFPSMQRVGQPNFVLQLSGQVAARIHYLMEGLVALYFGFGRLGGVGQLTFWGILYLEYGNVRIETSARMFIGAPSFRHLVF